MIDPSLQIGLRIGTRLEPSGEDEPDWSWAGREWRITNVPDLRFVLKEIVAMARRAHPESTVTVTVNEYQLLEPLPPRRPEQRLLYSFHDEAHFRSVPRESEGFEHFRKLAVDQGRLRPRYDGRLPEIQWITTATLASGVQGWAFCSASDTFSQERGEQIALGRAKKRERLLTEALRELDR